MRNAWRTFVSGKDGTPVLAQRPNAPILVWAACTVAAHFIDSSPWHHMLGIVGFAALILWALLEIVWGASYFRRALGLVVLAYAIFSRLFW